jgi:hypothetical protein
MFLFIKALNLLDFLYAYILEYFHFILEYFYIRKYIRIFSFLFFNI